MVGDRPGRLQPALFTFRFGCHSRSDPTAVPTAVVTVAPTTSVVVISVISESLNIRRGPSIYYDPVGFIKAGERHPNRSGC